MFSLVLSRSHLSLSSALSLVLSLMLSYCSLIALSKVSLMISLDALSCYTSCFLLLHALSLSHALSKMCHALSNALTVMCHVLSHGRTVMCYALSYAPFS